MTSNRKDATRFTEAANTAVLNELSWDDTQDFDFAGRGFVASLNEPIITDTNGRSVWELNGYPFLEEETAPPTVNPSLWRQSRLLALYHGLFKVTDGVYQIRGFDLSVMSIVETGPGYVVIDPLISAETARAGMELVYRHVGQKAVVAVIYTHSHVDHWGGVKGVISEADVKAGKIKVIAPEHFLEYAISENIIAGNVMSRRGSYMYGNVLPKDVKGQVGAGLGQTTSNGLITLIQPTDSITETGQKMTVDGLEIEFQLTPDTEAPAEMNFLFPSTGRSAWPKTALTICTTFTPCAGRKCATPKRGRTLLMRPSIASPAEYDLIFASHHWPTWGVDACVEFLKKQRDMYKYLHDETLRLANHGYTMLEIPEIIQLPAELFRAGTTEGITAASTIT